MGMSHVKTVKQCADSQANHHISGDLCDSVPGTLRSMDLTITVAKAGIIMTATGVGECDLHVFDQHGHPAIFCCKDVLYVPGVAKTFAIYNVYVLPGQTRTSIRC